MACGGWSNGKFALKTGFRYRSADDFIYPDGSTAENSFYTDKDIFITSGYKFSRNHVLTANGNSNIGAPWGKPVGFNGSDYMKVHTIDELSNNYALQYKYKNKGRLQNIEAQLFFSNESRQLVKNYYTAAGYMLSYIEITCFSDYYYGAKASCNLKITVMYPVIAGAEAYRFHISSPVDAIDYIDSISFENQISENARSYISGVFVQNNKPDQPDKNSGRYSL